MTSIKGAGAGQPFQKVTARVPDKGNLVQNGIFGFDDSLALSKAPYPTGARRDIVPSWWLDFDGSNDYVATDVPSSALTEARSFSVWVNPDVVSTVNANTAHRIINQINTGGTRFGVGIDSSTFVLFGDAGVPLISSPTIAVSTLYHAVVTTDGTTHRLYVNGVLQGSDTTAISSIGTDPILIGCDPLFGRTYNGKMGDVRAFDKELTQDEVNWLYTHGEIGDNPCSELEFCFPFEEGTGTTVFDVSDNAYTGTLTNGVAWVNGAPYTWANEVGYSKYMNFDSVDDVVAASSVGNTDIDFDQTDSFEIEITFNEKIGTPNSYRRILSFDGDTGRYDIFLGSKTNGQSLDIGIGIGSNTYLTTTVGNVFSQGQKTDVKIIVTAGAPTITVNGAPYTFVDSADTWVGSNNSSLNVGAKNDSGYTQGFAGTIYDVKINNSSSVALFRWNGYGNTNADWLDQVGSNDGTVAGSPAVLILPKRANADLDAFGETLQYTGKAPMDMKLEGSNCLLGDGSNDYGTFTDLTLNDFCQDTFSLEFWLDPVDGQPTVDKAILGGQDNATFGVSGADADNGFAVFILSSGKLAALYKAGGNAFYARGDTADVLFVDGVQPAPRKFEVVLTAGVGITWHEEINGVWTALDMDATNDGLFSTNSVVMANFDWTGVPYVFARNANGTASGFLNTQMFGLRIIDGSSNEIVNIPMACGAGTVCSDVSGNNRHMTLVDGLAWSTQNSYHYNLTVGHNRYMNFDGVNDYVTLGSKIVLSGDFSVSFEFITPNVNQNLNFLADNGNTDYITLDNAGDLSIRINNQTPITLIDNSFFSNNTIHNIIIERSGSTIIATLDGVERYNSNSGSTTGNFEINMIGWVGVFSNYLEGSIWDISIDVGGTGTNDHEYLGYGNTNADWKDQIGSNHGTVYGSPALIRVPKLTNADTDVFGEAIRPKGAAGNWINGAETTLDGENIASDGTIPAALANITKGTVALNGTTQYLRSTEALELFNDATNAWTVLTHFKKDTETGTDRILAQSVGGSGYRGVSVYSNGSELAADVIYNNSTVNERIVTVTSGLSLPTNKSVRAAVAYDGSKVVTGLTAYYQGTEFTLLPVPGKESITTDDISGDVLAIGASDVATSAALFFDGQVYEVIVYDRVLTDAEMAAYTSAGVAPANPHRKYDMAYKGLDTSGNNQHMYSVASPTFATYTMNDAINLDDFALITSGTLTAGTYYQVVKGTLGGKTVGGIFQSGGTETASASNVVVAQDNNAFERLYVADNNTVTRADRLLLYGSAKYSDPALKKISSYTKTKTL